MLTVAAAHPRSSSDRSPTASAQVYPPGVELFSQGSSVEDLWHIERGLVKLRRVDDKGGEVILDLAFDGSWLGTAAVIAGINSPASAVTCTSTRVARVPAAGIRQRLRDDPGFSLFIHELHAQELCRQVERIADLTSLTSIERLRRVMYQFITVIGPLPSTRDVRLQLPVHHWELAGLIAVTPEHLSRLLSMLQRDGLIRRDKGWVIVTDVRRLWPSAEVDRSAWRAVRPRPEATRVSNNEEGGDPCR